MEPELREKILQDPGCPPQLKDQVWTVQKISESEYEISVRYKNRMANGLYCGTTYFTTRVQTIPELVFTTLDHTTEE